MTFGFNQKAAEGVDILGYLLKFGLASLLSFSVQVAAETFASQFTNDLSSSIIPINPGRLEFVAARIFLAEPSYLEKWGIVNRDAAASYKEILKTIVLNSDMIELGENGRKQIASIPTLTKRHGSASMARASTIVHELAHAEFDLLVMEKKTLEDLFLAGVFENEILPWLKRRTPSGIHIFWPRAAASEFFAYYRGDLILFLHGELERILNFNGLSFYSPGRCFKLKRHDENRFLVDEQQKHRYRDVYSVSSIWVKGKQLSLPTSGPDPFLIKWQLALWQHFEALFSPPRTDAEFAARLNLSPYWRARLNECHIR